MELAAAVLVCFMGGVAFTLGAMLVCKLSRWAPVNITLNVERE